MRQIDQEKPVLQQVETSFVLFVWVGDLDLNELYLPTVSSCLLIVFFSHSNKLLGVVYTTKSQLSRQLEEKNIANLDVNRKSFTFTSVVLYMV